MLDEVDMGARFPIDYVKSCPYPFSFMSGYKLRTKFVGKAKEAGVRPEAGSLLWLKRSALRDYSFCSLETPNEKFNAFARGLLGDSQNMSKLLWVPPSIPYYRIDDSSPFNCPDFSKTLVFSCWAMVPRMITTLLSYEAERQNVKAANLDQVRYFENENEVEGAEDGADRPDSGRHKLPQWNLTMSRTKGRNAFVLLFPSQYLMDKFDRTLMHESCCSHMSLADLRGRIAHDIERDIEAAGGLARRSDVGNLRKLDATLVTNALLKLEFRERGDLLAASFEDMKRYSADEDDSSRQSLYDAIDKTREVFEGRETVPIQDGEVSKVADALALAAIASPAVCAMRSYRMLAEDESTDKPRELGYRFARSFVRRMNSGSATVAVHAATVSETGSGDDSDGFVFRFLDYCAQGNLQATLDEYFTLLAPSGKCNDKKLDELSDEVLGRRFTKAGRVPNMYRSDTSYAVQDDESFAREVGDSEAADIRMRTNIAAAFIRGKNDEVSDRRSLVRHAFNSPFRPFVLASTSVGKEGLDFHHYCRRVVHWNLPSNPIDLEQREGRVNRYNCLAVRQNLADEFLGAVLERQAADLERDGRTQNLWTALYEAGEEFAQRKAEHAGKRPSGLLPHWGVASDAGEPRVKIERVFYRYAFSNEIQRFNRIQQLINEYRMVLGQQDQELLLNVLREKYGEQQLAEMARNFSIDLCPFNHETRAES